MPLYYQYFNFPCTGAHFDYTIDIAPLKVDGASNYIVDDRLPVFDYDSIGKGFAFGFANIPTGSLKVIDTDNEDGLTFVKDFPKQEYLKWLSNEGFEPVYDEQGFVGSSSEDMKKTFMLDPYKEEAKLMDSIDFITFFTGKNSKLYDQDNNYVFSYSEKVQGPISINGNVFDTHQNYSINGIPINNNVSRGCSKKGHVSGMFFTHPEFEYTASARDHVSLTPWTPANIQNILWMDSSGIFPQISGGETERQTGVYSGVWEPFASSGVLGTGIYGQPTSVFTLRSGNRTNSVNPTYHHDFVGYELDYVTDEYFCNTTSYLSDINRSNIINWGAEKMSLPLGDDLKPTNNLGISLLMRMKDHDYVPAKIYTDGLELFKFGNIGENNRIQILGKHRDGKNYFKFKINGQSQDDDKSVYIENGDTDWHVFHWVYDKETGYVASWDNNKFLGDQYLLADIDPFPSGTDMHLQRLQNIELAEVIMYPQTGVDGSFFDNEKLLFIDGYLSHKWDLKNLPEDHPFYQGYPIIPKAGMKGGPLEHLYAARISNLTHF